jgi:hypothetical protein
MVASEVLAHVAAATRLDTRRTLASSITRARALVAVSTKARKYIASLFRRKPALSVGVSPRMPVIFGLRSHVSLGRKASDEFTVPLCRVHHLESTEDYQAFEAAIVADYNVQSGVGETDLFEMNASAKFTRLHRK